MQLSNHAKNRAAQRSIPSQVIEAIYCYGESYASRGCMGFGVSWEEEAGRCI